MDLLFRKYASPFSLLDGYIHTSRMCEFVEGFIAQKHEDDRWEFYLHKVSGVSYDDFCRSLETSQGVDPMTDDEIEATIKKSMDILGNFNPHEEEGEV